jgi:hypothetical protein
MSLCLLLPAINARGQAAAPQFFWVCYSSGGATEPNIYVSGVLQGPATAAAAFRVGFVQALMQRYSYQGNAGCVPARTAINAQDDMNRRTAALRNAKKNVVATGWTEAAPAAASGAAPGASGTTGAITSQLGGLVGGSSTPAATAAAATSATQSAKPQTQAGGNSSGANTSQGQGASSAASVLATLFGAPAGAGSGGGAAGGNATGQTAGKPAGAAGGASGAGGGVGGANTGAVTQVTSTLSTIFGSKGSGAPAPGGAGNAAHPGAPGTNGAGGPPAGAPPANANATGTRLPQGALGSAQFADTMLVVYGCGRQGTSGTQVLCVTDLTNQNAKDTLVQGDAVWKDAFIVDDRGDRHTRTNGYFLNIDGEQRQQLDIDNGKSAHFILAFDGIPAKVEKVELRSATGGLSVKGISLIAVGATDASAQAQPAVAH